MELRRFEDIQEFWHDAQDYLLQHEAEHNLLLGISHALLHYPERYPQPSYLAIAPSVTGATMHLFLQRERDGELRSV